MTFTFEVLLGSTTTRNRVHLPYCTSLSFLLSFTAFSFTFLYVYIIYVFFFFLPLLSSLSSSGVACIYHISLFFFLLTFFFASFHRQKEHCGVFALPITRRSCAQLLFIQNLFFLCNG